MKPTNQDWRTDRSRPAKRPVTPPQAVERNNSVRLLIVDDSNIIRSRIARLTGGTRSIEWQIVGLAKNGMEAINVFKKTRPEVVTMDLTMPEMDGVECIEAMVKLNPAVRILVVSALSDKATALKALKKGAQGFLHKPFTDEQLKAALQELVGPP